MSRGNQRGDYRRDEQEQRALTVIDAPRMPLLPAVQERGIDETKWRALIDAIYPSAKTIGGVLLALDYCRARNLDPFKRPVHVVPMWNSKLGREVETVWPGIGELRTTASRTGVWAGNDDVVFGRIARRAFQDSREGRGRDGPYQTAVNCPEMDFPEWAQITVYKIVAGQRVPFVGPKVFFVETFSGERGLRVPNGRWRQAPRQMLEKCAEAAALRRAFPEELAGELTAEEMEGQVVRGDNATGQAQYHYVDAEEADGGDLAETDRGGEQQDEQRQDADGGDTRNLRGWDPEKLVDYMRQMKGFFERVKTMDKLDKAQREEKRTLDSLPEQERVVADELASAARARIRQAEYAELERRMEPSDDDPPFVAALRDRLVKIDDVAALDELERAEKDRFEAQGGYVGGIARQMVRNRRELLTFNR